MQLTILAKSAEMPELNSLKGFLQSEGVDVALTYGDPNFYGKVGFKSLSLADAAAPLPLSYPEGWIGQSLSGAPFEPLKGDCRCVPALNDPSLW